MSMHLLSKSAKHYISTDLSENLKNTAFFGIFHNPTNVVNKYNEHAVTRDTFPEKSIIFQKSVINPMQPEKVSVVPFLYPLTFPTSLFLVLILSIFP